MSNTFRGTGNLGTAPNLRRVTVGLESRQVVDFRVYFDRRVSNGNGDYEDKGGFWMSVSMWDHQAELAFKLLQKGCRIQAEGTLRQEEWTDDDAQALRRELRLTADRFWIDPICVETVQYRPRKTPEPPDAALEAA